MLADDPVRLKMPLACCQKSAITNLCLIISRAGFDPCFPLAHVVRRSQVGVSVTPQFHSTELVIQRNDHPGDRRSHILPTRRLQDVDDRLVETESVSSTPAEPTEFNNQKATRFPRQSTMFLISVEIERSSARHSRCQVCGCAHCCGRNVVRSVALRMPSCSMSAGREVSTGFGPVS